MNKSEKSAKWVFISIILMGFSVVLDAIPQIPNVVLWAILLCAWTMITYSLIQITRPDDVYFAKLHPNAIIPSKRTEDAGYDIYACFDEDYIIIKPHQTKIIPTGLISSFDAKYYIQLEERGSTGTKGIGQRCGVIDSGYRDGWGAPITNHNDKYNICISKLSYDELVRKYPDEVELFNKSRLYPYNKAICQAVLLPVPVIRLVEKTVEEIRRITSERKNGKMGSSGK